MASLLTISSPPPTPSTSLTSSSQPVLFTSFKGTIKPLIQKPPNLTTIVKQRARSIAPLVVIVNKASIFTETSGEEVTQTRFRLDNLGPQPGSRKKGKRKGRGHAAGQGKSCGFGMRGQKSRSGPGVMKGFEGGQMPLYRRIPKLRGIAGGMHAGLPKYVPINLRDIESAGFKDGDEVSLESLKQKGIINPSGRERKLPLKILGEGELSTKLHIKARAFSDSAKEKLEAAGCSLTVLPGRKKWVKPSVAKNLARAEAYFAQKKASAAASAEAESA